MATHYRAPGAQKAACGDTTAKMFTSIKTSVTCVKCKNTLGTGGTSPDPYIRTN